jgi:WW domain-containing oxidoreductase
MMTPYTLSADGHELQFATNHLGHFLLVDLLKPALVSSAAAAGAHSRIVVVSSAAHHVTYSPQQGGPLLLHDINSVEAYHRYYAYGHSKLCNLLFVRELNQRLQQEGAPVTAVAAHPGVIVTPLKNSLAANPYVLGGIIWASRWMLKSIPQGAATQTWAATAEGVLGGEYYADCNLCPSSAASHDAELGRKLWELSEQLAGDREE